jgi:hypothetical protein
LGINVTDFKLNENVLLQECILRLENKGKQKTRKGSKIKAFNFVSKNLPLSISWRGGHKGVR